MTHWIETKPISALPEFEELIDPLATVLHAMDDTHGPEAFVSCEPVHKERYRAFATRILGVVAPAIERKVRRGN